MPAKTVLPKSRPRLRPATVKLDPPGYGEGRALILAGETRVLCQATIENGRPRWMNQQNKSGGWVTAEYSLLPRSTSIRTRRERGQVSGRTQEIQRLIGRSLRAVMDLEAIDNLTITVDCDVLQADGGTRCAAITGGFVALYQAVKKLAREGRIPRFPILDQVAAVSVGIVEGELCLDLDYEKDAAAEVDMNVVMTGDGRLIEVQGTAERKPFTRRQLNQLLELAQAGIAELFAVQKKALKIK